ncbi:MAG TPA: response regulator [Rhizomicrobium sp.]|nr:response regulator [Rhizomicrobium sp.]
MVESNGWAICVIDDDIAVRESTVMLLETAGYTVKSFASADELFSYSGIADIRCFVVDFHMPGLNGVELLESLRARGIDTPTIVLTGNGERLSERMTRAGVLKILRKPASEDDILQWIETALKSREKP